MDIFKSKKATESEKDLEARLVAEVKKRGGIALKYTSQFHRGIPDRIILLRHKTINFVELKSTGERRTRLQEKAASDLSALGFRTFVIDSTEKLEDFLRRMDARIIRIDDEIRKEEEQ